MKVTYSFADVHVAAVFDDNLALLCVRTISKRLDVLANFECLFDSGPHWTLHFLGHHKNHEENYHRNCSTNGKNNVSDVNVACRTFHWNVFFGILDENSRQIGVSWNFTIFRRLKHFSFGWSFNFSIALRDDYHRLRLFTSFTGEISIAFASRLLCATIDGAFAVVQAKVCAHVDFTSITSELQFTRTFWFIFDNRAFAVVEAKVAASIDLADVVGLFARTAW
jgi:hypothetical protein